MYHIAVADECSASIEKIISCLKNDGRFSIDLVVCNGYELIYNIQTISIIPDIFIVGTKMSIIDGIATNFFLSWHYPLSKIVTLSNDSDQKNMEQAIEAGAYGYVIKSEGEEIILTAIETILNGKIYIDARINVDGNSRIYAREAMQQHVKKSEAGLTPRERTFIMLSATTLSYDQISRIMFVEPKTIQTYFDRVSKKLNVNSRHSLTLFALQNGFARLCMYVPSTTSNEVN